jgi:hypothetical protein
VTAKSSSIVDNVTGEKSKVDETWVPEHHLRTRGKKGGRPDPDADEAFLPLLEEEGESEREGSK